jgi:hypothetical protein
MISINKKLLVGRNVNFVPNTPLYGIRSFDMDNELNIRVVGNEKILLNVYTRKDVIIIVGKFSYGV